MRHTNRTSSRPEEFELFQVFQDSVERRPPVAIGGSGIFAFNNISTRIKGDYIHIRYLIFYCGVMPVPSTTTQPVTCIKMHLIFRRRRLPPHLQVKDSCVVESSRGKAYADLS